jgi:hypothetical protein
LIVEFYLRNTDRINVRQVKNDNQYCIPVFILMPAV